MILSTADVKRIVTVAERLWPLATQIDGRGRTGGCLCVSNSFGVQLVCIVGEVSDEEALQRYGIFCQEKASRVITNVDHISSWQTRSFPEKKYGGAVKTDHQWVFSFSGLNEHLDEAFSSTVACSSVIVLSYKRWRQIQTASKNLYMNIYGEISVAA